LLYPKLVDHGSTLIYVGGYDPYLHLISIFVTIKQILKFIAF